ncbi:MAG: UDP-N-acetylmuramoyl-tripeptide--D-alanyl-D-alanine ligase [Myxococcota bacterium]
MIVGAADWTPGDIARAVLGHVEGDPSRRLLGVATDTRDPLRQALFVALVGEKHDAHQFLDTAVEAGASALLVEAARLSPEQQARLSARVSLILVPDTTTALGDLAKAHLLRHRSHLKIAGLTGSNGKTSTKEMLAALCGVGRRTLKTQGNLNNLIGLPMTALRVDGAHDVAVLEMGMNRLGEIARMTEIARPDVGLITNVGPAHIGELGGMDNIQRAKGELFRGLEASATAIVNLDDPRVVAEAQHAGTSKARTFGRTTGADVLLVSSREEGEGQILELYVDGTRLEAELPYPGAHNALNAAGAVAAATALFALSDNEIRAGLAAAERVGGRLSARPLGEWLLLDDSYNANSASTIAAIRTAGDRARREGRRFVAFLGEMRELGSYADEEHQKVGRAAAEAGAAFVAAFGPLASPLAAAASSGGILAQHEAEDAARLFAWARPKLEARDLILVKGSRGIHMEQFVKLLEEGRG